MHNSLRESFSSHRSKALLTLAILATTSGALFSDLKAQTPNNWGKAKTEVVDKNDTQRVTDFTKPLGVTIPAEWIKFASDIIQMLDADAIASAQMIFKEDLKKIDQDATITDKQTNKIAYVLIGLEKIKWAFDKTEYVEMKKQFRPEYITNKDLIMSIADRFAKDRQKRSETFIAQTQQEINQNKQEINQNKQEINQNKQEINQNNKTSEEFMLKTYKLNPNSEKLKTLAKETKQVFDKTGYKYSAETAQIFSQLGIK